MVEDIARAVFVIAVLGHGLAHAVASVNLGRQVVGAAKDGALTVRTPILPSMRPAASALLALVFWLPATVGFLIAVPAMLDWFLTDLSWSSALVAASFISTAGIALFAGIWPGGEVRLRALHVILAVAMNGVILVTQLVLGWPPA